MAKLNKSILIISDTHFPFHHRDTFAFLQAIKNEIKPDLVVHIGDEVDGHAWSFHTPETESLGPDREFELALEHMKVLYKMFPAVHVLHSNHGSLHQRKAKEGQIPKRFIRSYREAFDAPTDWHWHSSFRATLPNGSPVLFHHGMGANAIKSAFDLGCSFVQGHHHGRLEAIQKFSPFQGRMIFGMTVGCLINDKEFCYRYNKTTSSRPKIGCGAIINGNPVPIPMLLNGKGRWTKKL